MSKKSKRTEKAEEAEEIKEAEECKDDNECNAAEEAEKAEDAEASKRTDEEPTAALPRSARHSRLPGIAAVFALLLLVSAVAALLARRDIGTPPARRDYTVPCLSPSALLGDTLDGVEDDSVFPITDGDTLRLLADADTFGEYYRLHGVTPIVILPDGVGINGDVAFSCPVTLIMLGSVNWEDDGTRIRVATADAGTVSVSCNEPLSRFEIDAPRCGLEFTGGDIPFLYEVAESQNVASYNGSTTAFAADGETLGGTGKAKAASAALYTDALRTEPYPGSYFDISGNLITLYVPHTVSDADIKQLHVSVGAPGGKCELPASLDLSSPVRITVEDENGDTRTYRLSARRAQLNIPVVSLYTDDGSDIVSKLEYKHGYMEIDGKRYALGVRGRGNSSWTAFPKHSYRIKLDEKAPLLGMNADRDFCLIGNYTDPSLMRNIIAADMASAMQHLYYTPAYRSVDLFINGKYAGVYMLSEKIEDDDDRVPLGEPVYDGGGNITDMGFLIEFGWEADGNHVWGFFSTEYAKSMCIKEPEIKSWHSAEYMYAYNYVKAAEDAIVSGEGYEEYIDVDSWVDWFIVNELTNCTECAFYRSLYMYKPVGGKLCAGPIWDYDMAFGNHMCDLPLFRGWASVDFTHEYMYDNWMKFLTNDEKFMSRVRARWAEMKGTLIEVFDASIEQQQEELSPSVPYNFGVWSEVLTKRIGLARSTVFGRKSWEEHIAYIKNFMDMRYAWMDAALS